MNWTEFNFFKSGEYDVIVERLAEKRLKGVTVCPTKKQTFRALRETPYEQVRVVLCGQDPYPNPEHSTGLAFDIPPELQRNRWPPTLVNLLKEYQDDLHYPEPSNGSLITWAHRGVLLWNSCPSCDAYTSLSHNTWTEYSYLNKEIFERLSEKNGVVFVFLGTRAKENIKYLIGDQKVLALSHPSPRASLNARVPFLGSRMFSTINSMLKEPIDWKLP